MVAMHCVYKRSGRRQCQRSPDRLQPAKSACAAANEKHRQESSLCRPGWSLRIVIQQRIAAVARGRGTSPLLAPRSHQQISIHSSLSVVGNHTAADRSVYRERDHGSRAADWTTRSSSRTSAFLPPISLSYHHRLVRIPTKSQK